MDGTESQRTCDLLPSGMDELIESKAVEGFDPLSEVVGHQNDLEVSLQVRRRSINARLLIDGFLAGFVVRVSAANLAIEARAWLAV